MRFYNRLDRWSLRHADRVVTVCGPFARELESTAGVRRENLTIQHNSIRVEARPDIQQVRELKQELGIGENQQIVLSVGRLSREKAHCDLLQAFHQLCQSSGKMDLRLVIVGDGPERANLQAESDSLGIGDRVIFAGQVNNPHSYYAAADVLANSSHSEGSPYVLLEAMAAEVPVVATAVGGVPEILTHNESALLVPPDKPAAMAAAIEQVLNDANLSRRLVTNAADLVIKNHLPEQYARSLLTLYGDVLDARQRRAGLETDSDRSS
jgi:glycosyltransferase involved in cell wall biosynthesis